MSAVDWNEDRRAAEAIRDMAREGNDEHFPGPNLGPNERALPAALIRLGVRTDRRTVARDHLENGQ